MTKLHFEMSSDARLLYARLKHAKVDELVSYGDLTAEVSRPLHEIRGAIATATRRLLKDDGRVFACSRGEGLRRCTDSAIVDGATSDTDAVRRKARRGVEKLTKVSDFSALTPARQLEHTTRMSVLGAIATMTRETSVEKVRSAAQGRSSELPLAETVRAFIGQAVAQS
jgi:hypothetical protein